MRRLLPALFTAILLAWLLPVWMSVRAVGGFVGAGGNSLSAAGCTVVSDCIISVTRTMTASNTAIVSYFYDNNCPTVTQTSGDTLTQRVSDSNNGICLKIYTVDSVAGGSTTYTLKVTGATANVSMCVAEFNGLAASGFDQQTSSTSDGNPHATLTTNTTPALAQTTEIAFASMHGDGSGGTSNTFDSQSSGYTSIANCTNVFDQLGVPYANSYKLSPLTGAGEGNTWDFNGADTETGLGAIITFKEAATGGASPKLTLLKVGAS